MSAKHGDITQDVGDLVRLLVERPTGYITACVRACEGMDDPVAEIQAMREALAFSERDGIQVDGFLPYERIQSTDLFHAMSLRRRKVWVERVVDVRYLVKKFGSHAE